MVPVGAPSITVRVQMPESWDTVKVVASPDEPVLAVKVRALAVLAPSADYHEEFVLKLKGWEVFDEESTSLAAAGAVDGSVFLLQHRYRRPVR